MSTKVSTDLIDLSSNTGGLVWAKGPTTDQPAPASVTAGEMRVDTTTNTTLVYNGTEWKTLKEIDLSFNLDFLVVAAGGTGEKGGGGGGGLRTSYGSTSGGGSSNESSLALAIGAPYTVTVGAPGGRTSAGGDSVLDTITSLGGGAGNSFVAPYPAGGSGGGGAGGNFGSPATWNDGNLGTANQGFKGGNEVTGSNIELGGGGGGASAVGGNSNGSSSISGNGGAGLEVNIIGGTGNYYAGGGGGGNDSNTAGTGGIGGGGNGCQGNGCTQPSGTTNTGGGGGGGMRYTSRTNGFGGSGTVILRYPTAKVSSYAVTGTLDTTANTAYPIANTAYYKLDSNANDSSGNGYNGTATDVTYGNGRFGNAGEFNGTSSYISTGINVSTTLMTSRSYSFWFKQNLNTNTSRIFGGANAGVTNNGMFRIREDNGTINYYSINNGVYTWTTTLTNDVWTHVALTDTGSLAKLYINGVEIASPSTSTFTTTTNTNLQIGRGRANSGSITNYANGSIDQVRIFNSALSAGNVTSLYNESTVVESTDGTDSILQFIGGSGNITFS